MKFRGGEFSTGTMRNFQPELTQALRNRCHSVQTVRETVMPAPAASLTLSRTNRGKAGILKADRNHYSAAPRGRTCVNRSRNL